MTQHWEEEFKSAVSKMLLPHDSDGTALLNFLRHWMFRWRIHNVEAMDVLLEAVKRGLVHIQKNEQPIHNPSAWLRGTSLNVLRDKVKEFDKNKHLVAHLEALYGVPQGELPFNSGRNPLAEAEFLEQLETLQKSMDALSADDRLLIRMHFFEEKTYAQIQKYFVDRDSQIIGEATLRQRESRALKRLGKIFLKLYNEGADATH
jgi:RNA polymerase sigma factor (sigma-70 family)